jgi:HSP20 family protein
LLKEQIFAGKLKQIFWHKNCFIIFENKKQKKEGLMAKNELSLFKNFDPFEVIEKEFDDLWTVPFFKVPSIAKVAPLDISEDENNYYIDADLPGFKKDNVSISIDKGILTIKAQMEKDEKKDTKKYHSRERVSQSVTRSISLPENVDTQKIAAKYENGVLKLTLPKKEVDSSSKLEIKID